MTRFSILNGGPGPKKRQRHYSYDENLDEPGKLIDHEPTDVEHAVPADENEPVEQRPDERKPEPPIFEE